MTSAKWTREQRIVYSEELNHQRTIKQPAVAVASRSSSSSSSSSTTTTMQIFPDNVNPMHRKHLEDIKEAHLLYLGRPMPAPIAAQVLRDLDEGTPAVYYTYAIRETSYAASPSWRYTLAILKRLKTQRLPEVLLT